MDAAADAAVARPLLLLNAGCEMLYVLDQRLRAQGLRPRRAAAILGGVAAALAGAVHEALLARPPPSRPALWPPDELQRALRECAHASAMRLSDASMGKLFDLVVMLLKAQLVARLPSPALLAAVTLQHVSGVQSILACTAHSCSGAAAGDDGGGGSGDDGNGDDAGGGGDDGDGLAGAFRSDDAQRGAVASLEGACRGVLRALDVLPPARLLAVWMQARECLLAHRHVRVSVLLADGWQERSDVGRLPTPPDALAAFERWGNANGLAPAVARALRAVHAPAVAAAAAAPLAAAAVAASLSAGCADACALEVCGEGAAGLTAERQRRRAYVAAAFGPSAAALVFGGGGSGDGGGGGGEAAAAGTQLGENVYARCRRSHRQQQQRHAPRAAGAHAGGAAAADPLLLPANAREPLEEPSRSGRAERQPLDLLALMDELVAA